MKKTNTGKTKILGFVSMWMLIINFIMPTSATQANEKVVYPLQQISKLECRFTPFEQLGSDCKKSLPILTTNNYKKYAKMDWGYNEYTRLYTVLWWSSYKYWWDVWNGWHMWTDIATARWTPVYSIADWKVVKSGLNWMLWNSVSIEHTINWKTIVSSYSHLYTLNVSVWDRVNAWTKIWEVWSTWNSTWNHLHFQVDINTKKVPAYYDYNTCPFSYYAITEEWKCYSELKRLTVDPLLFLETKWAILNNIQTTTQTVDRGDIWEDGIDLSIFNRTVHKGYAINDIKQVQKIMTKFGYYNGNISGSFNDVEEAVIDYQVATGVIPSRNAEWAGWFGPATRAQAKIDYNNYLTTGENPSDEYTEITENNIETQTIDRNDLITREQIEALEVENFLKSYNIDLKFKNAGSNVAVWGKETLELEITDRRGKPFKWNMPGTMTFIVNQDKVNLFPTKLFYFTNWERDITVTWLKEGNTKLYIKVWNVTIKTFNINVYNGNKTIYPESAKILWNKNVVIWDNWTWIGVFQDANKKNMINMPFGSTFKLKANDWNLVCIKRWTLSNVKSTFNRDCRENEYKQEIEFTYEDTIVWLLLFDFKVTTRDAKIEIVNTYNNKEMAWLGLNVKNPKWLAYNYEYKNEVIEMLESWIAGWINQGHFLENRSLSKADWYDWIINSLNKLSSETNNQETKNKINSNINELTNLKKSASRYDYLTRLDFSAMTYQYLVFEQNVTSSKNYKDLDEQKNMLVSAILWKNTWKDTYWASYFQPTNNITRWEAAFLLSSTLENYSNKLLTLNQ